MQHKNKFRRVSYPVRLSIILLLGLFGLPLAPAQAQNTELIVFAAASLTDAFEDIATQFEAEHAGVNVLFNFAGSSDLAAQINEGAAADVFASANNRQMQVAVEGGRIDGATPVFARNRLVLITPVDNPAGITGLNDLLTPGVTIVLATEGVPVRDYTETLLSRLGEDYTAALMANVISEEPNVRQVSAKIALGEADAGFVYASDVTPDIADDVLTFPIPDNLNTLATYPIATLNDSAQPELAQAFVDYVMSDAGQDALVAWNFISVRITPPADTITLPEDVNSVLVTGQVLNPITLTADDLRANFNAQTLEVRYVSGENTVETSFTGVLLLDILNTAQPNFNANVRNDVVSTYIVVTGSDGYQAVISYGEIGTDYANQPILLAYEQDGAPIENAGGNLRLVVATDVRGSRYVSGVVNISLYDAPPVSAE